MESEWPVVFKYFKIWALILKLPIKRAQEQTSFINSHKTFTAIILTTFLKIFKVEKIIILVVPINTVLIKFKKFYLLEAVEPTAEPDSGHCTLHIAELTKLVCKFYCRHYFLMDLFFFGNFKFFGSLFKVRQCMCKSFLNVCSQICKFTPANCRCKFANCI